MANAAVGEVDIILGDKIETMRSTVAAARIVSHMGSGFLNASARIAAMDFDLCVAVIAAGLGKKPADVEALVFAEGVANLSGEVSTFITYLANGGKPPREDATGSGEA